MAILPVAIPHYLRVLTGIAAHRLTDPGFELVTAASAEALARLHVRADGVIAAVFNPADARRLLRLDARVVNVSNALEAPFPRVCTDDDAIGVIAARHLIAKGFPRLAFAGSEPRSRFSEIRERAFLREARRAGREGLQVLFRAPRVKDPFRFERERVRLGRRALAGLAGPCGMFAENDGLAGLILEWANPTGLRVPEDLGLMGVDDLAGAAGAFPHPLTSIELPSETIGRRAATMLLDWLRHPRRRRPPPDDLVPPGTLHERRTTGSTLHPDPLLQRALAALGREEGFALKASALARHVGTSRETLQRRFRDALGHSPREEIERRRFALAMDLLRQTPLRVGEIAARCGHAKQSTFATRFRRRVGMTPSEYRRRYRV